VSASTGFRRALLGAALLLALGAVWWVEAGDDAAQDARADDRPRRHAQRKASRPEAQGAPARSDVRAEPLPAARTVPPDRTHPADAVVTIRSSAASNPATGFPPTAEPPPAAVRDTSLDPSRIRRAARPVTTDAFAARSWAPPPKRDAEARARRRAATSAARAPPLPFTYLGMLADGERTTLFLARGSEDVVVREGEVVDAVWRLDHVDASQARFTYLPLQKSRSLTLGTR
jgi:hypothetical protein